MYVCREYFKYEQIVHKSRDDYRTYVWCLWLQQFLDTNLQYVYEYALKQEWACKSLGIIDSNGTWVRNTDINSAFKNLNVSCLNLHSTQYIDLHEHRNVNADIQYKEDQV